MEDLSLLDALDGEAIAGFGSISLMASLLLSVA
jgi:hypothetical protein